MKALPVMIVSLLLTCSGICQTPFLSPFKVMADSGTTKVANYKLRQLIRLTEAGKICNLYALHADSLLALQRQQNKLLMIQLDGMRSLDSIRVATSQWDADQLAIKDQQLQNTNDQVTTLTKALRQQRWRTTKVGISGTILAIGLGFLAIKK